MVKKNMDRQRIFAPRQFLQSIFALSVFFVLAGCGQKLDLDVSAKMDGQAAPQAHVIVDGKDIGATDAQGHFTKSIRKKAGAQVDLQVAKEAPGYRIEPWKTSFIVKLPKDGQVDKYSFDADLHATRFVTLTVTEKGKPVAGAVVRAWGKEVGQTDDAGQFQYQYKMLPAKGADLTVSKSGYSTWQKTGELEPGAQLQVTLSREAIVGLSALTDSYGRVSGVSGISVSVNGRNVGHTDARGNLTYRYGGEPGRKVQFVLSAPDYVPATSKVTIRLEGNQGIQRYFYPLNPKPIRIAVFRFAGNTPNVDLKAIGEEAESDVARQFARYPVFSAVPSTELQSQMERSRITLKRITTRGWRGTSLERSVDVVVVGSVAKEDNGYIVEAKFYNINGKLMLSEVSHARKSDDINSAAREIVASAIEHFPFEGNVVASDGNRYRINIGRPYRVSWGTELELTRPVVSAAGKLEGFRRVGDLKVKRSSSDGSWAEVEGPTKGEKVALGDRVVRQVGSEGGREKASSYFVLLAKGGVSPDLAPLAGVNVYLNDNWSGTTDANGKAQVPVRIGKRYKMLLYREGYQDINERIRIEKNQELKQFALKVNNALFKVDSKPSGATVFIDGQEVGKTPILAGTLVNLGFHTVRLSLGGDYRDWQKVVEFDKKVEDRTGDASIVLHKDYLKIGNEAMSKGDVDGAIRAYSSAKTGHPDYSQCHERLAQIYLDDKKDYDSAIREFQDVLSLPENSQLIHKQYAVTFTNLGHAYYEKGNQLVESDPTSAAQYFAKAVQALQTARENTRFFPDDQYDEAVHDTYYYLALSYDKLYLVTRKPGIKNSADLAWRNYFDFFPKKLEGNPVYEQARAAARQYWAQIKQN